MISELVPFFSFLVFFCVCVRLQTGSSGARWSIEIALGHKMMSDQIISEISERGLKKTRPNNPT